MMRFTRWMLAAMVLLPLFGCAEFKDAFREAFGQGSSTDDESFGVEYKPKYVIGVYQVVKFPRGGELEKPISTFDGKVVCVNSNQFFSSKNIEEVKLLPRSDRPDTYDLRVKLDRRGLILWSMLSLEYRDAGMALLVDGVLYITTFQPKPLENEDAAWVVLPGPFDPVTSAGILKYARKNYDHFNPSASNWF